MAKEILKNLPSGGAIVNDKGITTDGSKGGVFVGKRHSEGGIQVKVEGGGAAEIEDAEPIIIPQAVNSNKKYTYKGKLKSAKEILSDINTEAGGVPIKKKGGEVSKNKVKLPKEKTINVKPSSVIITRNAFLDPTKKEFNGKKLTNKEILSNINEDGGGVGFDDVDVKQKGGKITEYKTIASFEDFTVKIYEGKLSYSELLKLTGEMPKNIEHIEVVTKNENTDFGDFYEWTEKEIKRIFGCGIEEGTLMVAFEKHSNNEVEITTAIATLESGENIYFDKEKLEWCIGESYEKGGEVLLAPNGKPSNLTPEQWHLVRTPEFKAWFGDWINEPENASKVVDENGEPLVVYHGTNEYFNEFLINKIWSNISKPTYDAPDGFYFAKDKNLGSRYGKFVKPYFIGKEGVLLNNSKIVVCSIPNQIKLADGTNTTFDINNNDIRYQSGGQIDLSIKDVSDEFGEKFDVFVNGLKQGKISRSNGDDMFFAMSNSTQGGKSYPSKFFESLEKAKKYIYSKTKNEYPLNYKNVLNSLGYKKGGTLTNEEKNETYKKWKSLVNMSKSELENFYNTQEGKDAGLSSSEAKELGIHSGRESARWILKMKDTPKEDWTPTMWDWANRQISFISRMKGNKGGLYDEQGNKTRKHTSLLIWGHNPEKFEDGGEIENDTLTFYGVRLDTDETTDLLYVGLHLDDAESEFNSCNYTDLPSNFQNIGGVCTLEKQKRKYKFVYELDLEFETKDDYPLEDYYEDKDYYKLVEETDWELIKTKDIKAVNEDSDKLLHEVQLAFGGKKYNEINVDNGLDENDDDYKILGKINLRIADHTENIFNVDRFGGADYHVSVVIANLDKTRNRFGMSNAFERRRNEVELLFDGDTDLDEVVDKINEEIEIGKEYIRDRKEQGGLITSTQMQEYEKLKKEAMQELKGFETEKSEHNKTLENLEQHNITKDEAISEIVQEHLKENPNYYKKGGKVKMENDMLVIYGSDYEEKIDEEQMFEQFGRVDF